MGVTQRPDPGGIATAAIAILDQLIAIDTTSRVSNLVLIELVEAHLRGLGVASKRVANADGSKANLYATIGPQVPGGVVLSGHTDVVPVDGQRWSSEPFALSRRGDRLYGRGTSDMKAFLALALAAAPGLAEPGRLARPVHLAFSYDEEIGCLGAPAMIAEMLDLLPRPAAVIVGEPTNMAIVGAHKGIMVHRVTVSGHEAHSSLTHLGLSANMVAIRLLSALTDIADGLERDADHHSPFHPAHATLTIGQMAGGTAINILARECVFGFDLRCPPGVDPAAVLAPFHALVAHHDRAMKQRFPDAGIRVEQLSDVPSMAFTADNPADQFARAITGDNAAAQAVAYAAEAGQFQRAGLATVICGPGSIEQAHQPDEYIELSQITAGAAFMAGLTERLGT